MKIPTNLFSTSTKINILTIIIEFYKTLPVLVDHIARRLRLATRMWSSIVEQGKRNLSRVLSQDSTYSLILCKMKQATNKLIKICTQ